MSDSIFDDESILFLILINDQTQYSLWPSILPTPSGWQVHNGPMSRQKCMAWLETNWTDLRPIQSQQEQAV